MYVYMYVHVCININKNFFITVRYNFRRCFRKFHISVLRSELLQMSDNVAAPCEPPIDAWHRRQLVQFLSTLHDNRIWMSLIIEPDKESSLILKTFSSHCRIRHRSYLPYNHNHYSNFANPIFNIIINLSASVMFFMFT